MYRNTMNLSFENSKIKGKVVLTDSLDANPALLKDKTLYKFIWVVSGQLELDVDHQVVVLNAGAAAHFIAPASPGVQCGWTDRILP